MLYTLKGEGSHQRWGHIETGIRTYVHLSSSSPYRTVQMLPPRDSASPKFHGYLCLRNWPAATRNWAAATSSFIFTSSLRSVVGWTGGNSSIHYHSQKTFKEMQECHTSDTPFLLLLMSLPNRRARLSWEEECMDVAGHLISRAKVAFLFA